MDQDLFLEMQNVDLAEDGIVGKSKGHELVSLVRSSDPTDLIPTDDTRALWHRGSELVLEAKRDLYSRQVCAQGAAGSQTAGTATGPEITKAQQVLDDRADRNRQIVVPLPGDLASAAMRVRANRDPEVVSAVMNIIVPAVNTITVTVAPDGTNPSLLRWTATQTLNGSTATGFLQSAAPAPTGGLQRAPGIADIKSIAPARDEFVISYISNAFLPASTLVADTLELIDQDPLTFTQSTTVLDELRGGAAQAWATLRDNALAAFLADGTYRVYRAESLATVRDFPVTNPPPDGATYLTDHSAGLFPFGPYGVVWMSADDDTLHVADLDIGGAVVNAEASAPGVLTSSGRQTVAIVGASQVGVEWLVGWRQDNSTTIPALGWDTAEAFIRVSDLEGADMRLDTATGATQVLYDLRRDDTGERLTNNQVMGGLAAVDDSQFVVTGDEVVGAIIDSGNLYQLSWERSLDAPLIAVASTSAAALAQSPGRFVLAYWTSTTDIEIRVLSSYDDASPKISTAAAPVVYVEGNPLACAVLADTGFGEDATVRIHSWLADGSVYSVTLVGVGDTLTDPRTDAFLDVPAFAAATPGNPIVSPRSLFGVEYSSGSSEIWEVNTNLFVRVSPPLVVLAGGDWVLRGPWTRTRARQRVVRDHGTLNVVSSDAASIVTSDGTVCTFVAQEVSTLGAVVDIVSTHTERTETIDPTGKRPRVSSYGSGRAVVTYELPAGDLVSGIWSPGSSLTFAATGAILDAARAWDQTATETTTPIHVLAWADGGVVNIRVDPEVGATVTYSRPHPTTSTDVAAFADRIDDDNIRIGWAISGDGGGLNGFTSGIDTVEISTSTVTQQFIRNSNIAIPTVAVAVAALDDTTGHVWAETVEGTNRRVRVYDVVAGSESLQRSEYRAALASQLQVLSGQVVGAFTLLGGVLVNTKTLRNGVMLKAHTTGEIVGRLAVGLVEDAAERDLRAPHTGLNLGPDGSVVLGWQLATVDTETNRAPVAAMFRWDPNAGPHEPAVIDGIAVGAHGGYPRLYDGQSVGEHDCHELPEVAAQPILGGGGAMSPGSYTIAMTWERLDAAGQLYRSAPTFFDAVTAVAGQLVNLAYFSITQTEWQTVADFVDVNVVFWRTLADKVDLYREKTRSASLGVPPPDTIGATLGLISDTELARKEKLDQVSGGVLFSVPTQVTDFTASANSRIWSRDPAADQRVRYTVASRDFGFGAEFGLHWPGRFVLRHNGPGEVTAVAESDGQVVLMSTTSASRVMGDGPSETGVGGYDVPSQLRLDIGVGGQSAIARIPDGLVFGPPRPRQDCDFGHAPRLLTRGLQVLDLGEAIKTAYERDGVVADVLVYSEAIESVICADTAQGIVYLFDRGTQRWHRHNRFTVRDATASPTGRVAQLTADGRILLECSDRYDDGGVAYVSAIRTPWIHAEAGNPWGAGSLSIVHIFGTAITAHTMTMQIRIDYNETIFQTVTLALTPGPFVAEYRAQLPIRAVSIEASDGGEAVETFRLEGMTVQIQGSGGDGPDQVPARWVFTKEPAP